MKNKKLTSNSIFRSAALSVFIIILFVIGINLGIKFIKSRPYFRLTRILGNRELDVSDFQDLIGANIFNIDLKKIQDKIAAKDSYIRTVEILKRLPNEIYIRVEKRIPQARIDLGKVFLVDEEGVLLYTKGVQQEERLPLIIGLRYRIPYPLSGRKYNIAELKLALSLIKELRQSNLSKRYKIDGLDVSSITNAAFSIENGPQIRIGERLFKERLKMLELFLRQFNWNVSNLVYVDLRFREPVVKQK